MKHRLALVLLVAGLSASAQTTMNIYQSNGTVLQLPLSSIDSITFTVNNPGNMPMLTTLAISNITASSALSGGHISNGGDTPVTQRGVCWSTNPNPTTANNLTQDGSGAGTYGSNLSGLGAGTTYYVRAYAINSAGTAYGNQVQFMSVGGVDLATITTVDVSSVTGFAAQSGGVVIDAGGGTITQRGICWSIGAGPTTVDSFTSDGSGIGSFTSNLTGLLEGATYYVRAYAINSAGTAYGNEVAFTTITDVYLNSSLNYGTLTDQNGNAYATIVIGTQVWMAENLRSTFYANGDPIPNVPNSTQWVGLTSGAWAHYMGNSVYENPYGKLYNWYAVADPRNVCPTGWHVPSETEWSVLSDFLGGQSVAGDKMRSIGSEYWSFPNTGANNESGFSGLPGGYRNPSSSFSSLNTRGYWWSTTELTATAAFGFDLYFSSPVFNVNAGIKTSGYSIRCLMD